MLFEPHGTTPAIVDAHTSDPVAWIAHDHAGRVTTLVDPERAVQLAWNAANQLVQSTPLDTSSGGPTFDPSSSVGPTSYKYNDDGDLLSETSPDGTLTQPT